MAVVLLGLEAAVRLLDLHRPPRRPVYDADKPNRLVLEYCEQMELTCLDLLPGLREAYSGGARPLYFPQDRHLNVAGNRRAAKMIFQFLQRTSD